MTFEEALEIAKEKWAHSGAKHIVPQSSTLGPPLTWYGHGMRGNFSSPEYFNKMVSEVEAGILIIGPGGYFTSGAFVHMTEWVGLYRKAK